VATVGGLFDGCGLLAYGLHLAGWEHRWLCEKDEFRRELLEQRFPGVPIYADVREVGLDAEAVDLIAGGFPCKGISVAGQRAGFDHPETALWREMLRVVRELRPRYVIVENVAALLTMRGGGAFRRALRRSSRRAGHERVRRGMGLLSRCSLWRPARTRSRLRHRCCRRRRPIRERRTSRSER
jgi:site-specific DNA-cytosine methylase